MSVAATAVGRQRHRAIRRDPLAAAWKAIDSKLRSSRRAIPAGVEQRGARGR